LALVIGSGGVKCSAALGLLRVLDRAGISLDMVVGCSAGSLYAGGIALGYPVEKIEALTNAFWGPELLTGYAASMRALLSGKQRFSEKSGMVQDGPLNRAMDGIFEDTTFAETRVPLYIVATDVYSGEMVVLQEGSLREAARASVAIPTVFPPHPVDGHLLMDGAASNPLPIDVAIKAGADIILAMAFELDLRRRMQSLIAVNSHLNAVYINNMLRHSFSFHSMAHHSEIIPLVPTFDSHISTFSVAHIPQIIEEGEALAEQHVPYLKRLLEI
jgi:NTE family protein